MAPNSRRSCSTWVSCSPGCGLLWLELESLEAMVSIVLSLVAGSVGVLKSVSHRSATSVGFFAFLVFRDNDK